MTTLAAFAIAVAAGVIGAVLTLAGMALILALTVRDELKREEQRYRVQSPGKP